MANNAAVLNTHMRRYIGDNVAVINYSSQESTQD